MERREEEGGGRNLRGRPGRASGVDASGWSEHGGDLQRAAHRTRTVGVAEGGAEPAAASWRRGWARVSSGGRWRSTASELGHDGELQRAAMRAAGVV